MEKYTIQVIDACQQIIKSYNALGKYIHCLQGLLQAENEEPTPIFPANHYAPLVQWIQHDPYGALHYTKSNNETWQTYAARVSAFAGWIVDPDTLRLTFLRKSYRKR